MAIQLKNIVGCVGVAAFLAWPFTMSADEDPVDPLEKELQELLKTGKHSLPSPSWEVLYPSYPAYARTEFHCYGHGRDIWDLHFNEFPWTKKAIEFKVNQISQGFISAELAPDAPAYEARDLSRSEKNWLATMAQLMKTSYENNMKVRNLLGGGIKNVGKGIDTRSSTRERASVLRTLLRSPLML